MRVDFPAPLGPSNPMARPRRAAVRPRRISRLPNLTWRRLSSMTGTDETPSAVVSLLPDGAPSCIVVLIEFQVQNERFSQCHPKTFAGRTGHYGPSSEVFLSRIP